jgi:hypothetical protein
MLLRRCMLLHAAVQKGVFFAQTPIWGFEHVSGRGRRWRGSKKGYKRLRLPLLEAAGVKIKGYCIDCIELWYGLCRDLTHGALIKNLRVNVLDMHPGQEHGFR